MSTIEPSRPNPQAVPTSDAPDDPRRRLLLPLGAALATATVLPPPAQSRTAAAPGAAFGLEGTMAGDQSARLQVAIDRATERGVAVQLPAGRIEAGGVRLRPGTHLIGAAGAGSVLTSSGRGAILSGVEAHNVIIEGVTLDGGGRVPARAFDALLQLEQSRRVRLRGLSVQDAARGGVRLVGVSGSVEDCVFQRIGSVALFSLDAVGLDLSRNTITDCGENGILVWRSQHGEDATTVTHNRILRIRATSGGSGQNGNAINVYRAGRVMVAHNVIEDCAYSAVRANEASNVQMIANNAVRIGEVAFYAEAADERAGAAGFEGAVMTANVVDDAATGLVVTNFNQGGRLAVVQGNLVRNLKRREHEAVDKRGEGIAVEADAVVTGNVIEGAPTCGLMIGWGRHMREVVASNNLIRRARIGIAVTGDAGAGQCLLTNNLISGATEGAIRAMALAMPMGGDLAVPGVRLPRHVVASGNVVQR